PDRLRAPHLARGDLRDDAQADRLETLLGKRRGRETLDRLQRALHLPFVEGDVLELAGEVVVVGGHVAMTVAGEVEQDRALLPRLVRSLRDLKRAVNRVRRFRRRENSLAAREQNGGSEDVVLEIGLGADQPV